MTAEFRDILACLESRRHLNREQARQAILYVCSGEASEEEIRSLLLSFDIQAATAEELAGAAGAMRELVVPLSTGSVKVLDTCGTGGDVRQTFNISTTAALIAAGSGVKIVKHGNRSASSKCGSADVLEHLGVNLEPPAVKLGRCLEEANICFAFARAFHPAMKHVGAIRRAIGKPTIFNLLGPLTNPAHAKLHLLGVFSADLTERLAEVLRVLGSERAWVVHAADGLDEISTMGPTRISELNKGTIKTWELEPGALGLARPTIEQLQVADVGEASGALRAVLDNQPGPRRDIALLNAAAAVVIGGKAKDLRQGMAIAEEALKTGAASRALEVLVRLTRD